MPNLVPAGRGRRRPHPRPAVRGGRSASPPASLLDLAPPADHVAGRWALALVIVGYVAGRVRQDVRPTATAVVATVAASSFVGTSVFALSGLLLRDPAVAVPDLLQVILVAVLWDVLLTPFVLPLGDADVPPARARAGDRLMARRLDRRPPPRTRPQAATTRAGCG